MTAEQLVKELPKGIIKWYGLNKGTNAIYVTTQSSLDEALIEALRESGLEVTVVSSTEICAQNECSQYDYAVAAEALETYVNEKEAVVFLEKLRQALKDDGKLFLCTDNRLAIKYFCGDRDPYTERNFDGIEDYRRVSLKDRETMSGRLYAKAQLIDLLENAGIIHHKFYSIFPCIDNPQILISEEFIPTEELNIRIFPQYNNPDTVFIEEENLYTQLADNNMLHIMANGFFIECPMDGKYANADQVTVSIGRGRENAMSTIIRCDKQVEKRPLYREGLKKAEELIENTEYLTAHGIKMVNVQKEGKSIVMPYVSGRSLAVYFKDLLKTDINKLFNELDRLWNMILSSSEHVSYDEVKWEHFDPRWDDEKDEKKQKRIDRLQWRKIAFGTGEEQENLGVILKRGYIDLVLINGFEVDGEFVFFDQEIYVENMPAKTIMNRNINFLYHGDTEAEKILPRKILLDRYKISEYVDLFHGYEVFFMNKFRNDRLMKEYYKKHRRNNEVVHSNRQRMNFSTEEYLRLFANIFNNLDNKRLFIFGSGNFAKKFLALYRKVYDIAGILDNDADKWGSEFEGIKVTGIDKLNNLDPSTYKVIICIKNYTGVFNQLKKFGVTNIGIYDTNMEYPRKTKKNMAPVLSMDKEEKGHKKYHVGYVAGVFDLFHVGHLNLLKRAKEQCDYLIVGVVTDEGVRRHKNTASFIPFEERLALVQACRYVDEAVEIPLGYSDTKDAYLKFQFDVQFSGSDYVNDTEWMEKREFLQKHGADLVFFPYTESTSSTKIKEMIDKKLM